jgi:hypothetical protein
MALETFLFCPASSVWSLDIFLSNHGERHLTEVHFLERNEYFSSEQKKLWMERQKSEPGTNDIKLFCLIYSFGKEKRE